MGKPLNLSKDQKDEILEGLAFLSRIFWGPTPEICREVAQNTPFKRLPSLSHLQEPSFARNMRELDLFINGVSDVDAFCGRLEEEYIRLFINAKGGVVAPLYESCYEYEGASLMGPSAVLMRERLESKGLSVSDD
ncbi:MAG: molecular chaperone TorD family protein, partial [Deltaproteobacteria bacterium]|nr:molecular chaperone TorD family protein [Deltaproteobacteria bacterium]